MPAKIVITVTDGKDGFSIDMEGFGNEATKPEIEIADTIFKLAHTLIESLGAETTKIQRTKHMKGRH